MKKEIEEKKHSESIIKALILINNCDENIIRNTVMLAAAGTGAGTVLRICSDFPGPLGEWIPTIFFMLLVVIGVSIGIPFVLGTAWSIFAGLFFIVFSFFNRELSEEYFDGRMTETASFGMNIGIMVAGLIDGFMFAAFFSIAGIFAFAASIIFIVVFVMIAGSPGEID